VVGPLVSFIISGMTFIRTTLAVLSAALVGCSTPPPAPRPAEPASTDTSRKGYTAADVRFMRGMSGHHGQALVMSALVANRTAREVFHSMAERIRLSQESEIAQMQRWLDSRGEPLPAADANTHAAMGHGELMPGMLTQDELRQLENARGNAFERLFLELMIKHHEGALKMVKDLYATPGAGQEPELFMLASDVDADQTAEIRRMRALLATVPQ
jgi:uncharacterized protein (DUF305 family)